MNDVERVFQYFDGQQYEYIEGFGWQGMLFDTAGNVNVKSDSLPNDDVAGNEGEHGGTISESNVAENANTKTESAAGQIPANEGKPIDDNAVKASPESSAQKSEGNENQKSKSIGISPPKDNLKSEVKANDDVTLNEEIVQPAENANAKSFAVSLENFKIGLIWINQYLQGALEETLPHLKNDLPNLIGVDVDSTEVGKILWSDNPFEDKKTPTERFNEYTQYLAGRTDITITEGGKRYTTAEYFQRENAKTQAALEKHRQDALAKRKTIEEKMEDISKLSPDDFEQRTEKELLAQCLISPEVVVPAVKESLTAERFSTTIHQKIFESIVKTFDEGIPPNGETIFADFQRWGYALPNDVELQVYILRLAKSYFTTADHKSYVKLVNDAFLKRQRVKLAKSLADSANNPRVDNGEFISSLQRQLDDLNTVTVERFKPVTVADYLKSGKFDEYCDNYVKGTSRSFGFDNLDKVQDFMNGVYIIAGVPGIGKSTFAVNLAFNIAKISRQKGAPVQVIYFSLEMHAGFLMAKIISMQTYVADNQSTLTPNDISKKAKSAKSEEIRSWLEENSQNLSIMEDNLNIDKLLNLVRTYCKKDAPPPIVFIDYLQELPPTPEMAKKPNLTTKEKIDDVLMKLKNFSLLTDTTFFVISALNRQNYKNSTGLLDVFSSSAKIEYVAVATWVLDYYNPNNADIMQLKSAPKVTIKLTCPKNRNGQSGYEIYFNYYGNYAYFVPAAENTDNTSNNDGGEDSQRRKC